MLAKIANRKRKCQRYHHIIGNCARFECVVNFLRIYVWFWILRVIGLLVPDFETILYRNLGLKIKGGLSAESLHMSAWRPSGFVEVQILNHF